MGESYRGLTIKIGGDTTGLSRALKSANASIRQTQSELRKINKGLKFDPSSAKLITMKVAELRQESQQANAKLATLRKTLNSLKGTQVEKLANQSKNLALEAENARQKYARIDSELAELYQAFQQVAKANKVAFDKKKPDEMVASLRKLGLIDDELYAKMKALKKAHNEAFGSMMVHKQALQYKDLQVEIKAVEAEIRSLNAQQTKLKSDAWTKQRTEIQKLKSELRGLAEQGEAVNREFRTLESAAKLNPGSVQEVAAAYKGLQQRIDLAKLQQEALNQAMAKLQRSGIEQSESSMQQLVANTQKAERRYQALATQIGEVSGKLQLARQEAAAFEVEAGKGSTAYKEQAEQVKALEQRLDSLTEKQQAASKALSTARGQQEMREYANQARAAANEVQRLSQKQAELTAKSGASDSALKSIGMTAYATVSPAFMALGYKSVEAADRIDSSFRDMKKTVNGTEEDFDNLREAALEFSRTHAVSADTILEIEAMGGQLGIAVDKLQDFGTVVSNLDIATNMNADDIAEQLGQLNNILPDLNDNYEAFGDSLVRLGNNMPAQESAIMDVTSRIGSLGGIVGMSTPQVLAWATAIAATGQNSEAAGTAISNTMSDIEGAVASGGDKLEGFAKVAGMSAEQFAKSWNETPSDAMKSFVEGLHSIDEQGGSVDATLQGLGITGVRQKQALEGLAQTTDVLNDALTMSGDAWNGVSDSWGDAGDAAREAAQKSEGFSGTLQILKNSASEFGYELGNALVPFMQAATAGLQTLTAGFKDLPGPVKDGVVAIGLLGAASGTLITMYSSLSPLMKNSTANLVKNMAAAKANGTEYRMMGVNMNAATAKINSMTKSTKVANVATKGLVGSLKLLKAAGGAIAFVGLDIAVEAFMNLAQSVEEAKEKEKNFTQATTGLKSAVSSINTTNASSALDSMGDSAEEASASVDELADAHNSLSQQIRESNEQVATTKGQLDEYSKVISDLSGTTDDGAEGYGKLKAAVDGVNQSCGTSYEVVKNAAGAYVVMKDNAEQSVEAIQNVINAQKRQVESEALLEQTKELYKQKSDDLQAYTEQLKKTQDAWDAYNNAEGTSLAQKNDLYNAWQKENEELSKKKDLLDSSSDAYDKATQQQALLAAANNDSASANTKYAASCDELKAALMNASGSSTDFISAMDNAGISLQELGDSNQDALIQIASAWDGNIDSVISKVDELGDQVPQSTRDAVYNAAAGMLNASPEMVAAASSACNMTQGEFFKFANESGLSGDQAMNAFVAAIRSGQDPAAAAAAATKSAASGGLSGFSSNASSAGSAGTNAFASSIARGAGSAMTSSMKVASSAKSPLQSVGDSAYTWGSHLVSNFASGISGMVGSVANAARAVADKAASILHFTQPDEGPWSGSERGGITSGKHLAQNFANGITSGIPDVYNASESLALSAQRAMDVAGIDPTINVHAVITDLSLADGVAIVGSLNAAALASRAAASSAAAQSAADSITTVTNNTVTNVYQAPASEASVIQWLDRNLPQIIENYTPVMGERDFNRKVRAVR